jgi:hypothetical protein
MDVELAGIYLVKSIIPPGILDCYGGRGGCSFSERLDAQRSSSSSVKLYHHGYLLPAFLFTARLVLTAPHVASDDVTTSWSRRRSSLFRANLCSEHAQVVRVRGGGQSCDPRVWAEFSSQETVKSHSCF